ncbi:sigma-70 family RNA polymerase sigma factor [Actinomadura sp. WMMB 499]|uniref:sigma-70 family RNA polymerase sigma factor n=1 Tax=Actinomadura sp. WMMB 499 TaxID=1219491 RepID=UPI001248E3BB|nr:sigma-70 family RNA polymerase sigma factor [Actinomadura sp. WMMB 499]QFG22287.1 sigma-70 family RNA polymerase sigma factor [Actinomadura sp. WMMB 499]
MTRTIDDQRLTLLALSARNGTPADFDAFTRACYADVLRFTGYLSDPQSAEDLTQETFLRAMRSLPAFAGRSSARTWLLSIARRVVIDRHRASLRRPVVAGTDDWERAAERARRTASTGPEDLTLLKTMLDELPTERREALLLTQIVGLSYAEAAEALGCPIGTVRSRVARARTELARALRPS